MQHLGPDNFYMVILQRIYHVNGEFQEETAKKAEDAWIVRMDSLYDGLNVRMNATSLVPRIRL